MRYLILSDIHANREALEAVEADAAGSFDETLCCGDLVGYGAEPNVCVDWVRANCSHVVRGNHDKACTGLDDLEWFNPIAREAALWTAKALTADNADYARALPKGPLSLGGFEIVHGSALDEDEYVLGPAEAELAFGYMENRVEFFGHSILRGHYLWNRSRVEILNRVAPRADRQLLDIDPAIVRI